MKGFTLYEHYRRVERQANEAGFAFAKVKIIVHDIDDSIALIPINDKLPIYHREAELFRGDLDQVEAFLDGIRFVRRYYEMLKLVDDKRIARKEQDYRNKELMRKLKEAGKAEVDAKDA